MLRDILGLNARKLADWVYDREEYLPSYFHERLSKPFYTLEYLVWDFPWYVLPKAFPVITEDVKFLRNMLYTENTSRWDLGWLVTRYAYKEADDWTQFWCFLAYHPQGPFYSNPAGDEPDWSCSTCGMNTG